MVPFATSPPAALTDTLPQSGVRVGVVVGVFVGVRVGVGVGAEQAQVVESRVSPRGHDRQPHSQFVNRTCGEVQLSGQLQSQVDAF